VIKEFLSKGLRWTMSPLAGRAVKDASLFDGRRGQCLRTEKERGHLIVHALIFGIARAYGREV
jgi:hypothetical protein